MGPTRPCSSCDQSIPADAAFCPACGAASASPILGDTLLGVSRGSVGTATSYELAPDRLQAALGPSYQLGRLIGRGGYAEVFAVRDLRLKRELALKVLRPDLILTDSLVTRFRREAEAVGALQNTHIVPIYDVGEADGICWLLMPLVQGETLKSVLAREQRLPVAQVQRILLEAAEALQTAHEAGVVHRDIKPENLMIDGKTGRVLLMDFGIAKAMDSSVENSITGTGVVIGTPQYMSPEQAMGKSAPDPRSDQYSLAIVGYQMLTGRVPFMGENVREVIARQLLEEPIPLSRLVANIPAALSSTIHQAMRKEPARRFASMDAFAKSLKGELLTAAEGGVTRRESKFAIPAGRHPWLVALGWIVVLGGLGFASYRAGLFASDPGTVSSPLPESTRVTRPESVRRTVAAPKRQVGGARRVDTPITVGLAPPPPATCEAAVTASNWTVAFARCTEEAASSPLAARRLGMLYAEGHGVERNERLAAMHFTFAADSLDPVAVLEMARRYETGRGVTLDQAKAARKYLLAANLDSTPAIWVIVARRFEEGNGLSQDPKEAVKWYQKAADAGDALAMTRLGAAFEKGRGVKKDEAKSTYWYSEAAKKQEPEAEYQIGMMLLKGKGGFARDERTGLAWLTKAAGHGNAAAKEELAKRGG
ncbi:MAG TPA: protein kinase [Gemmatimonadales bacterium]|nr:protein kinase [Gemmatimonadales bacterium]